MSAKSIRLCDCKGNEIFWIVQEKSHFNAIFLVYGVKCRGKFSLVDAPLALQFKVYGETMKSAKSPKNNL